MSSLKQFILKRAIYTTITLFAVSLIIFAITQLLPGDAAQMMLGQHATEERIAILEEQMGLNEPVHIQYINWVSGVATGDMGHSLIYDRPVADVIEPRLIRSLQLALLTTLMVIFIGIPLGVFAAIKRGSKFDTLLSGTTYVGVSLPEFVTGTVLLLLFAGPIFGFLPGGDYSSLLDDGPVEWLRHLLLPSVTLTIVLLAHVMRQTRTGMIQTLRSEYVRTARLKGVAERDVLFKHALQNALLPTITVLALNFGWLMGSLVIVEEVFSYPGIGRMVVGAIQNRDIPLIQGTILVIAASYIIANTIADTVYTRLDPRIEYGE